MHSSLLKVLKQNHHVPYPYYTIYLKVDQTSLLNADFSHTNTH